jgi:hypothetical protein
MAMFGSSWNEDNDSAKYERQVQVLRQLIADLVDVAEYDFENCDFSPSSGMMRKKRELVMKQARVLATGFKPKPASEY